MFFSSNLSYLRVIKNKTQEDVASEIGITQGAVGNYESGRREPSLEEVIKFAILFSVSIDDLLVKDLRPAGTVLGKNLRYLRRSVNTKGKEIAKVFGVSPSIYSRYENGLAQPDMDGLIAISEFFGVAIDDLLKIDLSKKEESQ